jgi:hypothetical protein
MMKLKLLCGLILSWVTLNAQDSNIKFIENKCQWDESVKFVAKVPGGFFQSKSGELDYILLDLNKAEEYHYRTHEKTEESDFHVDDELTIDGYRFNVSLVGANFNSEIVGVNKSSEYYNYFLGSDLSRWQGDVSAYNEIIYSEIYAGIDLMIGSIGDNLKYEFVVHAGADPNQILLQYLGTDYLKLLNGNLIVGANEFYIKEDKPVIYQNKGEEIIYLKGGFEIVDNQIKFCIEDNYDPCYPLIIDPILIFSTYSGSTADNWGSTATPGDNGTLYSAGVTNLGSGGAFPASTGAFQVTYGGLYDVGILKYDSTGSHLLYASYLGGSASESPHSLVVNSDDELLVLGTTGSTNFPTSLNAYDRTFNGGIGESNVITYFEGTDIFISKINRQGDALIASTLLGGTNNDGINPTKSSLVVNYGDQLRGDIITDISGNIYVSTVTSSADFPTLNSFGLSYKGGISDALVIELNPDLSQIIWSGFLGGSGADASHTIKFDLDGNLVVGGGTSSIDFPIDGSGFQNTNSGGVDGWIARINSDGTSILSTTYTGTTSFDQVYFIDLDEFGNIFAYGQTSGNFPTTAGVYKNPGSGQFLQKFDPTLTNLEFSTVFGSGRGIPDISPTAFLVNDCDNIYLSGWGGRINSDLGYWNSSTNGLPITSNAYQKTTSGSDFYFIVLKSDGSELLYATYLGGPSSRTHVDGGTSRFDKSGIVYHAVCSGCKALNATGHSTSDFPVTANAWSKLNKSINCNNAAFKFDLSLLAARIQTNSVTFKQPGLNKICIPDNIVFENKSTGGQYYVWDFGDGESITKTDTAFIVHQYQNIGTYKVKLKVVDLGTCQAVDSTYTTIYVNKSIAKAGPDDEMCFDAGAILKAEGGVQYIWTTLDGLFSSNLQNPLVNPENDTEYFVTITDENGCVKKDTLNIKVIPGIDLKFDWEKLYDCNSRPSLQLENKTETEYRVFFDLGDGNTSDLTSVNYSYENDGKYDVKLVGEVESCVYENIVPVPIYTLFVPNVITPDEYPENNYFKILYGGKPISTSTLTAGLTIYNRWGKVVYKNDDYKDDWNASNVETGIYFYELISGGEFTCKGWVHVIK